MIHAAARYNGGRPANLDSVRAVGGKAVRYLLPIESIADGREAVAIYSPNRGRTRTSRLCNPFDASVNIDVVSGAVNFENLIRGDPDTVVTLLHFSHLRAICI